MAILILCDDSQCRSLLLCERESVFQNVAAFEDKLLEVAAAIADDSVHATQLQACVISYDFPTGS